VYRPRGAAKTVFECRADEVLIAGPAGTGKSRACLEKLHMMCLLNPGMRALIVRKTSVSLTNTALVTYRDGVAPEAIARGIVKWYGGSLEEAAGYRYENGSRINIGGMDKPTKIMSSEYDVIYVQEATELSLTDWEMLTSRLRNGVVSFQQILADCNPDHPNHWLKARCDRGITTHLLSKHTDNPVYFDDDGNETEKGRSYMARLKNLTGLRKLRLLDGIWAGAEGVIYDEFDPSIHVVPKRELPAEWTRYWSVDFGFKNPFVCQCWAEDPDGRLWLEWEVYYTERLVQDHAQTILDQVSHLDPEYVHPEGEPRRAHHGRIWTGPRPARIICDHDAEDRATLERELGIGTVPAKKSVSDGIQASQGRYRVQDDGKPRIFFLENCVVERDPKLVEGTTMRPQCTVEELPAYIWDTRDGKPPKDTPLKENDHGCDAKRYMVAEKDLVAQFRMRWAA
jgi:PBSX family phage terminase large subunit